MLQLSEAPQTLKRTVRLYSIELGGHLVNSSPRDISQDTGSVDSPPLSSEYRHVHHESLDLAMRPPRP